MLGAGRDDDALGRHVEAVAADPGGAGGAMMGHAGMGLVVEQSGDARLARELRQGPLQQLVAGLGREGEAELDHAAGLMLGHAEAGGQAGGSRGCRACCW